MVSPDGGCARRRYTRNRGRRGTNRVPQGGRRDGEGRVRGQWLGPLRARSEIGRCAARRRVLHTAEYKTMREGVGRGGRQARQGAQQSDIERPNEITWPRAQTKMTAGT